jgi:hypothetical protein
MLHARGYGVTDLSTRAATQPATIFEIGSITKQFTAALLVPANDHIEWLLPKMAIPMVLDWLSAPNNRQLIWHAGQIGGFYTENVVFLDNGFTLIVLTNDQDYDTDPFIFKILNAVCDSSQLASNC